MKAFDYETFLIRPGLVSPKPVVMSVAGAEKGSEHLLTPKEGNAFLREAYKTGEVLCGANICFDLGVACADDPTLIPFIFEMLMRGQFRDTHIRQALLDIGRGTLLQDAKGQTIKAYSLQNIAEKMLGLFVEKANTPRLTYARLDGVPFERWTEEEREYSRKDARVTYDVVEVQGKSFYPDPVDDAGIANLALEPFELRAMWALHLMSCWGPRTDPEMVEDVTRSVTEAREAAVTKFTEAGIYRGEGWCRREKDCEGAKAHKLNSGCWKSWLPRDVGTKDGEVLKDLVRSAYQDAPPRTEGGGISTSRDTLEGSGDPLLEALAEAGETDTEFKVYLDVIARGTEHPICTRYDPIKKTARVGSRDPNLTNIPRAGRTRECFVPRDFRHPNRNKRNVYCSTDYPSLELWTWAETCLAMGIESTLAPALARGDDMHAKLAGLIDGLEYEEAYKRYKARDSRIVDRRQYAKEVNYGCLGGMGVEKLVFSARKKGVRFCEGEGLVCGAKKYFVEKMGVYLCVACVEVATVYHRTWKLMVPEARDYFDVVAGEVDRGELIDVKAPEGLPRLWCAGKTFTAACNLRFQGLAARAAKDGIARVSYASYVDKASPLFGCRPTMFIHDELISELPEVLAHDAAFEQARLMGEALMTWCPKVACDKSAPEPALMRRWFKKAEKVLSRSGKLKPWWPERWDWVPDREIMEMDRAA